MAADEDLSRGGGEDVPFDGPLDDDSIPCRVQVLGHGVALLHEDEIGSGPICRHHRSARHGRGGGDGEQQTRDQQQ